MANKIPMYLKLVEGGESEQKIDLLLSLTRFGENTKQALKKIYCFGWTVDLVCLTFDLQQSNVARSIKAFDEVNQTIHQLKYIS